MFIHNIDPVLLHIGPLQVRYYGIVYALGFLVAYFILRHMAQKGYIKNLTAERAEQLIVWLVIGVVVGSRLGHVFFWNPSMLWTNPLQILYVWQGGLAFHGGLIGVIIVLYVFCKKYNMRFLQITDVLSIIASLMLFFGRIANFVNGELVGRVTQVPWGVNFHNERIGDELVYRHPSQLYESLKNLFNFFVLFAVFRYNQNKKTLPEGFVSWLFVTLYGLLRFVTNFWREDTLYFGLSTGQWLSLMMFITGSVMLVMMYKNTKPKKRKNTKRKK